MLLPPEPFRAEVLAMAREGDPWARILRASSNGTGLRLTAEDVSRLAGDRAIYDAALEEAGARIDAR